MTDLRKWIDVISELDTGGAGPPKPPRVPPKKDDPWGNGKSGYTNEISLAIAGYLDAYVPSDDIETQEVDKQNYTIVDWLLAAADSFDQDNFERGVRTLKEVKKKFQDRFFQLMRWFKQNGIDPEKTFSISIPLDIKTVSGTAGGLLEKLEDNFLDSLPGFFGRELSVEIYRGIDSIFGNWIGPLDTSISEVFLQLYKTNPGLFASNNKQDFYSRTGDVRQKISSIMRSAFLQDPDLSELTKDPKFPALLKYMSEVKTSAYFYAMVKEIKNTQSLWPPGFSMPDAGSRTVIPQDKKNYLVKGDNYAPLNDPEATAAFYKKQNISPDDPLVKLAKGLQSKMGISTGGASGADKEIKNQSTDQSAKSMTKDLLSRISKKK